MSKQIAVYIDKDSYLNESIEVLGLNARLYKILMNNQIHTLRDLISRNVKDIGTLPGIGPVFRSELLEVFYDVKLETE